MDTSKWPQEFVVKPMNEIVTNTCLKQLNPSAAPAVERKARPEKDEALNCPRCNSLNTKFCYYNNYSLTQPRYLCKDCRRYWTEGGSLRNIPIGGGIRKNKRKKTLFVNNTNNKTPPPVPQLNPKTAENAHQAAVAEVQELAFSQGFGIGHLHHTIPEFLQVVPSSMKNNNALVSTSSSLELLGISNSSFYTTVASEFGPSYPQYQQEFMRPALGFSLDGGNPLHEEEGRPLLPFESLKLPVTSSSTNTGGGGNENDHHHHSDHKQEKEEGEAYHYVGFWNGMLSAAASDGGSSQ